MEKIELAPDFKEFLKLLNSHKVEYLLVGGYAVGYYGYPRTTDDLDIWVSATVENADRLVSVFRDFGFSAESLKPSMFLDMNHVLRVGVAPVRIDVLKSVSGLEFDSSFKDCNQIEIDDFEVNLINLSDLKTNKQASGRHKDLDDLEHLP